MELSDFEQKIGITFKDKSLLQEALTHRSYLNENPDSQTPHNERLEFLGDAVLELIVTETLFKKYPSFSEGDLTSIRSALVNHQILSKIAKEIGLDEAIFLSRGEAKDTGRAREIILANAFEALLGAIYLDQEYDVSKNCVDRWVLKELLNIVENKLYRDPKSMLQEIVQEKNKVTPSYEIISENGPDHAKIFEAGVYFNGDLIATGKGFSKQEAEVEAAQNALKKLTHNG